MKEDAVPLAQEYSGVLPLSYCLYNLVLDNVLWADLVLNGLLWALRVPEYLSVQLVLRVDRVRRNSKDSG